MTVQQMCKNRFMGLKIMIIQFLDDGFCLSSALKHMCMTVHSNYIYIKFVDVYLHFT